MKWNKQIQADGNTRIRRGFLWFPRTVYKKDIIETRWLEVATYEETYMDGYVYYDSPHWKTTRFIEMEK